MAEKNFVLKGIILYSETKDRMRIFEPGFLVCMDGVSAGVFETLPEQFRELPVHDYGDALLIPGLTDLHTHAPQYSFRGTGMDLALLKWLETHTFPEEMKYQDLSYAEKAYSRYAESMKKSATTRAVIFGTVHKEATLLLADRMEETGLCTMIGKVNMDRNCPDGLRERSAEESAAATREWIRAMEEKHYKNTSPILTPRFLPSCSDELMELLSAIRKETGLPVQSHLSENQDEISWVKELCPWSECYGDAYDHFGLFGREARTVMAHCVHSGETEIRRMKENGVYIAHCPESNLNLTSGIAPVKRYLSEGMHVGLGSDLAAGSTENIFRAMAHAIQASRMRCCLLDQSFSPLTVEEVFYMGTKGGGSFFGKAGSFEPGYELDVVVLDDERLKTTARLTQRERLERMIYLSDEREVKDKYVKGRRLVL